MTESCGMCAVMAPEQFALGEVGAPVPCVEVKLVDVPELGYLSTNKDRPQGEIWIRGPSAHLVTITKRSLQEKPLRLMDGSRLVISVNGMLLVPLLSLIERRTWSS